MNKSMNMTLWILQVLLAFYMLTGGIYMMGHHTDLSSLWARNTLPPAVWTIIGVLQILFSLGLVVPGFMKGGKMWVVYSAAGLAVISLLGAVLYSAYAGSGIVWALLPAAVTALIAYKRR